ncbi:helix-turn-helix transcriptional regulator, partial [Streptomyces sp. URMC 129]|uniref:helix-turn-helix transcriptional regulator n=1 Tax=Streptomyces sp. URMC 129 TaxID=3423407 RepID=UPI003F1BAC5B
MSGTENDLFAAVDALVEQVAARHELPPPHERKRLRTAAGLTQREVADRLGVTLATVAAWEAGRTSPRPPQRAAYARLLDRLAGLFPPGPP